MDWSVVRLWGDEPLSVVGCLDARGGEDVGTVVGE